MALTTGSPEVHSPRCCSSTRLAAGCSSRARSSSPSPSSPSMCLAATTRATGSPAPPATPPRGAPPPLGGGGVTGEGIHAPAVVRHHHDDGPGHGVGRSAVLGRQAGLLLLGEQVGAHGVE